LIKEIENLVIINDTIMVKGSNYTKVSKIVEKLKDLGNDAR
jgi:UDP-N-acetylmuramyl pentapeptide synthase